MVGQSGQIGKRRWYVSVDQKVYGPFDETTLWAYVQEGRVTGASLVSISPSGPFGHGTQHPAIHHWFRQAARTPLAAPKLSVHLVMADIRSSQAMTFLQTLQFLGPVERLGDSVWLVQTHLNLEETRRTLGPTLSAHDNLFLLNASEVDYASVNLSEEARQRIEALFEDVRD